MLLDAPGVPWQESVSAVSTLTGSIAATVAAVVAVVLAARERADRKSAEAERDEARLEATQRAARRVFGWIEVKYEGDPEKEVEDWPNGWCVSVLVGNFSDEPMVQLRWNAGSVEEDGSWFSSRAAGDIDILPPGEVRRVDLMKEARQSAERLIVGANMRGNWPFLILSYEDASGGKWLRDRRGILLPRTAETAVEVRNDSNIDGYGLQGSSI